MRLPVLKFPANWNKSATSRHVGHLLPEAREVREDGALPWGPLWYRWRQPGFFPCPLHFNWLFRSHTEPFTLQALRDLSLSIPLYHRPPLFTARQPDLVLWLLQAPQTPSIHSRSSALAQGKCCSRPLQPLA